MGSPSNTSPSQKDCEKQAEGEQEALNKWLQQNTSFLEILLDAYCVLNLNDEVVGFNDAFKELTGVSHRKILKVGNFSDLLETEFGPDKTPGKQVAESGANFRSDEVKASSKKHDELYLIMSAVPIKQGDSPVGVLLTIRDVTAESKLQKKYYTKKEESVTDGLTGLYNKRFIEDTLNTQVQSALRNLHSLSVIMCDIDHFKMVNDTYGHQAGDYVLSIVSGIIRDEVRGSDIVGRYGGEEFIVLLAGNNVSGAAIFAERLRKRIEETPMSYDGKEIPVTMSLGTFTFQTKWTPGIDVDSLAEDCVKNADTALYAAKEQGRNRFIQFEHLPKKTKKAS